MSKRKKQSDRQHEISMECNGKHYSAYYYIENGMVTVEVMSEDAVPITKSALIGWTAEHQAQRLLKEIIDAGLLP